MKKLVLLFVLSFIVWNGMNNLVGASESHYIPGGKNYISQDNLAYDQDSFMVYNVQSILVKPEMDYVISFNERLVRGDFELIIFFFDNLVSKGHRIVEESDLELISLDGEMHYYFHFMTSDDVNYIGFELYNLDFTALEGIPLLQLEEGQIATSHEQYVPGTIIDTQSPYFQSSGTIISYVDQPITLSEIQNSLIAYDTIDGDVSDQIVVLNDGYTDYMDTLGSYIITFEVSDSSENKTSIDVHIEVVDILSPVFSDLNEINAVFPNVYSVEDIIDMLSASDNYDGDISNQIINIEDEYTANSSTVGTYEMLFSVADSSGNEATHQLIVNVVDEKAPIITGVDSMVIGYNHYFSEAEMIELFTVQDDYDQNVSLVIDNNQYKDHARMIGEYSVVFSATDSSGNQSIKTLVMQVVDQVGPMIYLDKSVIQVYSNTVMSLPDFVHLLTKTNELNHENDYQITVRYDSYQKNATKPGTYHLRLSFKDQYGEVTDKDFEIRVVERGIDDIYFGQSKLEESFFIKNKFYFICGGVGLVFVSSQILWYYIFRKKKM